MGETKNTGTNKNTPAIIVGVFIFIFVFFMLNSGKKQSTPKYRSGYSASTVTSTGSRSSSGTSTTSTRADQFIYAHGGETWKIYTDNLPLFREPKSYESKIDVMRNIVLVLTDTTVVEVRERKGVLDIWQSVYVINNGLREGWIYANMVKYARRIK